MAFDLRNYAVHWREDNSQYSIIFISNTGDQLEFFCMSVCLTHLCHMALKRTPYLKLVIGGLVDLLESAIRTVHVGAAPISSQPINHVTVIV